MVLLWQILELRFKGDFYNFLQTTVFPQGVGSQVHLVTTSGALHQGVAEMNFFNLYTGLKKRLFDYFFFLLKTAAAK